MDVAYEMNKPPSYIYSPDKFYLIVNEQKMHLVIDYRYRLSLPFSYQGTREIKCILNETLLSDIRFGFTNHIGRLGI